MSYSASTPVLAPRRKSVFVRMPPALKRRLADDVKDSGRSFNDVAVGHLAANFAMAFEPSGRSGGRPTREGGGSVVLRMPPELKERLVRRAAERRQTVNELIVGTLSERLGPNGKEAMASNNGKSNGRAPGDKVRVALIGVGNCANSLLQGVEYYKNASSEDSVPGLMHVDLGGYHINDIQFVAAFDVVKGKVGVDLADAI